MTQQVFKTVCMCENCGNEAEMTITCSREPEQSPAPPATAGPKPASGKEKTPGHAVCSNCGAEADMWIDM